MAEYRDEKIGSRIKELAAMYIEREGGLTSFITLTRVELLPNSKKATLYISVLPREKEQAAYGFIKRNLGDIRKYIEKNLKIRPVPFLEVVIDEGEKNRQRIDEILIKDKN